MNELMLNPVLLAVILMLLLSFFRVHIVFSLLVSAVFGGLIADIPADKIQSALSLSAEENINFLHKLKYILQSFESGIGNGTSTALSYAVLGAFAVALSYSGLLQALSNWLIKRVKEGKSVKTLLIFSLLGMSILSQNLIPVHIAFIPLVVPPLLLVMNKLQIDRRALTCVITFGLICTFMFLPYGFGNIYLNKILLPNVAKYGMDTSNVNTYAAMAIPALGMVFGLLIALFVSYRKPRIYKDIPLEGANEEVEVKPKQIIIATIAVILSFLTQKYTDNLTFAGLVGFAILMCGRIVNLKEGDEVFSSGIRMMSMIAFIMITSNGFAAAMHATGGIEPLVAESVRIFAGSKALVTLVMLIVGLFVTMGIGSSFATIPIIAAIYVPMCAELGFSPMATVALIGTAGVLGDAGAPPSDSTLGPTMGFNADGQHDHIKDSVVSTFIHFNIPLIIFGWIAAMVL